MPTYVIGDIQGCYTELMSLLEKIHFNEHSDRLWLAGDLINRGPDSLKVLRFLSALGPQHQSVLGNHDLYFLSVVLGGLKIKKSDTLSELYLANDRDALTAWLLRQPLALYDQPFNTLVIHAGVMPNWTLATTLALALDAAEQLQSERGPTLLAQLNHPCQEHWDPSLEVDERWLFIINCLTRLRIMTPNGKIALSFKQSIAEIPLGFMPWYQVADRLTAETRIVFGHWAALSGKTDQALVHAIDTGCAWGNSLTAYRLEDGARFSVQSTTSVPRTN